MKTQSPACRLYTVFWYTSFPEPEVTRKEEKGSKVFTLAGVGLPGLKLANLLEMDQLGSCKLGWGIDHTL